MQGASARAVLLASAMQRRECQCDAECQDEKGKKREGKNRDFGARTLCGVYFRSLGSYMRIFQHAPKVGIGLVLHQRYV